MIRVNLSNMHMITISESHTGGCSAVAFNPLSSEKIATLSMDDKTIRSVCFYSSWSLSIMRGFACIGFGIWWTIC